MYNRYIPRPDGSYQKSRHPDQIPAPPAREHRGEPPRCDAPPEPEPQPQPKQPPCAHLRPPRKPPQPHCQQKAESSGIGVGSFLRQLLPKDFDTEDLIVILLLLLMSSDCQEDQNTALLTLALYLFL